MGTSMPTQSAWSLPCSTLTGWAKGCPMKFVPPRLMHRRLADPMLPLEPVRSLNSTARLPVADLGAKTPIWKT